MLIGILFIDGLYLWNLIIMFIYYSFLFYAIGRIIQNLFNFNKTNLFISYPLGFCFFLIVSMFFQLPFVIFDLNDNLFKTIVLFKEFIIIIVILIYYESWILKSKVSNWNISKKNIYNFIYFILFFLAVILFNYYFVDFNQTVGNFEQKELSNSINTSIPLNYFNLNLLVSNNFLTYYGYYHWFLYLIAITNIYFISMHFSQSKTKFPKLNNLFGFGYAFITLNLFWLLSTESIVVYEFLVLYCAFSILIFYYQSWNKNENHIILFYLIIVSLFAFSFNGLFYYSIFFFSTIIYQRKFSKSLAKIFIIGFCIFLFEFFCIFITKETIVTLIILFLILIPFFPYTINYFMHRKEEDYFSKRNLSFENQNAINTKLLPLILFFVFFFSLMIYKNISSEQPTLSFLFNNYYGENFFLNKSIQFNWLFLFLLFDIPMIFIYIVNLFSYDIQKEASLFSIVYVVFINPISMVFLTQFYNINFLAFLLFWVLFLIDILVIIIPKVFYQTFIKIEEKNLIRYERKYKAKNRTSNQKSY